MKEDRAAPTGSSPANGKTHVRAPELEVRENCPCQTVVLRRVVGHSPVEAHVGPEPEVVPGESHQTRSDVAGQLPIVGGRGTVRRNDDRDLTAGRLDG